MQRNVPGYRLSARELAALLCQCCESLFQCLIPDAHFEGGEIRGHAPDGGVVAMAIRGRKRGRWKNFNTDGQSGDCLDFVAWILFRGDLRKAYVWVCHYLGITARTVPMTFTPVPTVVQTHRNRSAMPASQARNRYLRGMENSAEVASYLSGRLGTRLDLLLPELPGCLRFVPDLSHPRIHQDLPAMVAPVISLVTFEQLATHATFLTQGYGGWYKAPVKPAKICLGSYSGGIIELLSGSSGRSLRDMRPGEKVLVGEGIENALAAAALRDEPRACGQQSPMAISKALGSSNSACIGLLSRIVTRPTLQSQKLWWKQWPASATPDTRLSGCGLHRVSRT
jgi:hypothetical protein